MFVSGGLALYVIDISSGGTIRTWGLGHTHVCSIFCVANPTALSRDGRYLAIELSEGVQIVDTERGIPLYRLDGASSVATDPGHPTGFFLLNPAGHIRRVRIDS